MREACNTGPPDVPQKGSPPAANQGRRNQREILTRTVSVRSRRVKRPELIARSRTPEPPYCWQAKQARRLMREKMNGHESTSSLLSLYDAMTEEASNQESEVFTAGQPYLGALSGLSARTVQCLEPLLEEFGVVQIQRPKLRGHNTYKLIAFGQGVVTLRHNDLTLRHGRIRGSCRPVERTEKEQRKNREEPNGILQPAAEFSPDSLSSSGPTPRGDLSSARAKVSQGQIPGRAPGAGVNGVADQVVAAWNQARGCPESKTLATKGEGFLPQESRTASSSNITLRQSQRSQGRGSVWVTTTVAGKLTSIGFLSRAPSRR